MTEETLHKVAEKLSDYLQQTQASRLRVTITVCPLLPLDWSLSHCHLGPFNLQVQKLQIRLLQDRRREEPHELDDLETILRFLQPPSILKEAL